jgi:tetratricopeptide (TPR) repeat protein
VDQDRSSILRPVLDPALELSDSDLFWQAHWRKFVWGLAGLVLLILAVGLWKFREAQLRHAAEALYSSATGEAGWREVVEKFPGSIPAGNARLELASALRAGGDTGAAAAELEQLLSSQPDHPLAGAACLMLGELRQLQGEPEAALEAYRRASSAYRNSYAAPLALLAEAKLLESRGSAGEARAVLQSIGSLHPGTPAAMIAEAELARRTSPTAP